MTTPYDASPYLQESPYLNESAYLQGEAPEGLSPLVRLILMRRYGVYVFTDLYDPSYRSNYSSINERHQAGVFDTDLGRVSVLSNCGLTLSEESLAQALKVSANEFALFLTIWSYEYGYRPGRVFRRDFDLRALALPEEQRYTEQIMHYLSNPYYNPDGTERIVGGLPENYVPYEWQQPMSRANFTSMERNRRPLQMVSGVQNALIMAGALYQQLLGQQQAYNQTDQRDLVALRRFLAQHDALPAARPENTSRENRVFIAACLHPEDAEHLRTMKEALALAAAYSRLRFNGTVGDLSLSIAPRLKLRRSERTRIAHLLNRVLEADPVGARYDSAPGAEMYKRLVKAIHPGDYPSLTALSRWADELYRGEVYSFESLVDRAYATRDAQNVARLLSTRPGVFARQLVRALDAFEVPRYGIDTAPSPGQQVIFDAFAAVAPRVAAPILVQIRNLVTLQRNALANPPKERPANPVAVQEDRELADYARRNPEGVARVQNIMQNAGIPNPLGSFFGDNSGPENPMRSIPVGSEPAASQREERRAASTQKAQPAAPRCMNLSKTGIATMIPSREYSPTVLDLLERLVEIGLSGRLAETSIYLPDEVGDMVMPLNTRSARPSLDGMGRYNTSTVHLPPTGVIRLFCFWDEGVDIDLSLMMFDAEGNYMDKISYWSQTAKNSQGAIYAHHSGDITDGTGGAWEYIDIEARKALKAEVCYLVPVVQLYSGFGEAHTLDAVNDLQAGFMVVPAVGVGEVHEVSQVHTKFTLRAESRGVLPFIVDLQNRDPYDIPDETDAIVKVTDIGLARGINVLQSGANITAVREHFDWAQPMTVREYLRLTGAKLAPTAEEAQQVLEATVPSLAALYVGFENEAEKPQEQQPQEQQAQEQEPQNHAASEQ